MKVSQSLAAVALAALAFGLRAQSQSEKKDLTFDVASVKPSQGCPPACGLVRPTIGNQGYHAEGSPLRMLITIAYSVTDRQISGGPAWLGTDRFDIEAKGPVSHTTDELHVMLQHLLEERFNLKVRRETRQESVWALLPAKTGSTMPVHDTEDKDYPPIAQQMNRDKDGGVCFGFTGRNATMNYFAFFLSRNLGRTVIDQTGLPARYDINLRFLPDGVQTKRPDGGEVTISPDCFDIFSAMPKQLGLRLEAAKGPTEYLVIEHVEKPTEN